MFASFALVSTILTKGSAVLEGGHGRGAATLQLQYGVWNTEGGAVSLSGERGGG
jgi:hypothetical protein